MMYLLFSGSFNVEEARSIIPAILKNRQDIEVTLIKASIFDHFDCFQLQVVSFSCYLKKQWDLKEVT